MNKPHNDGASQTIVKAHKKCASHWEREHHSLNASHRNDETQYTIASQVADEPHKCNTFSLPCNVKLIAKLG
tara:strand:- start:321 stop:536 length:216 start_codon:yes stop_codon:yes gene_type:complete